MEFAVGKAAVQGAKCGREEHGVTKVFELQGKNFFRPRAHDENCSSYSF